MGRDARAEQGDATRSTAFDENSIPATQRPSSYRK